MNMTDDRYTERQLWLSLFGVSESDVMWNADGDEYIFTEYEDDGVFEFKKVELPNEIQSNYVPF